MSASAGLQDIQFRTLNFRFGSKMADPAPARERQLSVHLGNLKQFPEGPVRGPCRSSELITQVFALEGQESARNSPFSGSLRKT